MNNMKKATCRIWCLLLAIMLLIPGMGIAEGVDEAEMTTRDIALARPESEEPTHVTVGNTTHISGSFFSTQFGNNTTDIDVRYMLHGYNPVVWADQIQFIEDEQVTTGITKQVNGAGNTVYTIGLQKDLTWNDGTPITAADYVFSYLLLASKEIAEIGADTAAWKHIAGYEEYVAGEADGFYGIRMKDDYTFSVEVKKEYEPYFYEYSYLFNYPYPMSVLAPECTVVDDAKGAKIVNKDPEVKEPLFTAELLQNTILDEENGYLFRPMLSCGPYKLVSCDRETGTVEFELNTFYKGNYEGVKPVIDTVTLVWCRADEVLEKLENNEIDIMNKVVDADVIDEGFMNLVGNGFYPENYPRLGYGYLAVSTEQGPQQFMEVRQALAYCMDQDDFVNQLLRGYGLQDYGYYGLGQWMYQAASGALRPEDATDEEIALWDAETLDALNHYDVNYMEALKLLIADGWVYNSEGEKFDPDKDDFRYKKLEDESLMKLSFRFAQCEETPFAQVAVDQLQTAFQFLNAELVVDQVAFTTLLEDHYRASGERTYDLSFMATNFVSTFDPMMTFLEGLDADGAMNTAGFYDEELSAIALDMHNTVPGALLEYLTKWCDFQERFNEILPTIPLYTNIYVDFVKDDIHNYYANSECNWPVALIYAYRGEEIVSEEDGELETEDEDVVIFE